MTKRIKLKLEEEIEMLYAQLDVKEAMIKNYTAEIETQRQQLAIAVKSLSTITHYAPTCFRTEECPLEGGCGFDNGCFRCGFATAFEALQQIKELEK